MPGARPLRRPRRSAPTPSPSERRLPAHRAAARVAAIGALLVTGTVIYLIVQAGTSRRAPTGTTTRTATAAGTVTQHAAVPTSQAPKQPARPCADECPYVVPGLFTATVPRSWRKQISRYPGRARVTLTAPSGPKIYIEYTRSPSTPNRIRPSRGSHVAPFPRGERQTFHAAFCRHHCTDYLLNIGGHRIAILTRSVRPAALATAARIARTIR